MVYLFIYYCAQEEIAFPSGASVLLYEMITIRYATQRYVYLVYELVYKLCQVI